MLVYRVEDETGRGMYWGGEMQGHRDAFDEDHPGPADDPPIADYYRPYDNDPWRLDWGDVRFGFCTMEQLTTWVSEHWREGMHERGQRISIYEVPDEFVILGDAQVIFDKMEAARVETASLLEIGKQLEIEWLPATPTTPEPTPPDPGE